jgi:uncharacterized protein (DUF58 family)
MARSPSLLDPRAISKGAPLGLMARRIVEGYRVGEHRSPLRGFAIEFAQHREYTHGDDIRHLDWKVLGRSDRYYIKQYEQDTNYVAHILVDGSESMSYGSEELTKMQYAKVLAACLAHLILIQRDAAALAIFDTEVREYLPRTDNPGKINLIMDRLSAFEPSQGTRLGDCLEQLALKVKSRGIVILISDFLEPSEELVRGLRRLTYSGNEVIVFQVLDPAELTLPFKGAVQFVGLEGAPEMKTLPSDIRNDYLKRIQEHLTSVRQACERHNSHYVLADTGKPLAETLAGYLAFRRRAG